MRRNPPSMSMHSQYHQHALREQISRQVDAFLKKGGKIEQLSGPRFLPHRAVGINSSVITDVL